MTGEARAHPSGQWDGWGVFARDLARLLRDLSRDDRVPRRAKLVAAVAAGYAVSPIDLVPSFVPFVGWFDDLVALTLGLRYLLRHAGYDTIDDLWQGDANGFALVLFLGGVEQ